jgi:TRAP-type C4-dicarboxylate transport system substrate-binding protein
MGLSLLAGEAPGAEYVFGSWVPAGDHFNRVSLAKTFAEIAKETSNDVTWKLVPGGQLADAKSTYQAVQSGLMHGGLAISTYVPNLVPSLNTLYSTIVFSDDVVASTGAALEVFTLQCPSCVDEFRKLNLVALGGWTGSPYYLACREPVRNLSDLAGKRVRGTGGLVDFIKELGAVPVAATLVEAVGLLQRGGLDCQFGVHGWLKVFGYADVAKYVTTTPLGLIGPAVNIWNRDMWNAFSADQKNIHLKQMSYVTASEAIGQFVRDEERVFEELRQTKGVQSVQGDDAGFLAVAKKYDAMQRDVNIRNARGFGVQNPEAIIDNFEKAQVKWKAMSKDIGRDIDKFAATIQREIYDKIDLSKL